MPERKSEATRTAIPTPVQEHYLAAFRSLAHKLNRSPSVREVARKVHRGPMATHAALVNLENLGILRRDERGVFWLVEAP